MRPSSSIVRTVSSLVRAPAERLVAVDEEELVDAVGRRGEEVAPEAEEVAVAGVEAGDGAPAHRLHLVGDGDARDGGPADVVVGDEEAGGDRAEHADLVAYPFEVGRGGRLDLADELEGRGGGVMVRSGEALGEADLPGQRAGLPSASWKRRTHPVDS